MLRMVDRLAEIKPEFVQGSAAEQSSSVTTNENVAQAATGESFAAKPAKKEIFEEQKQLVPVEERIQSAVDNAYQNVFLSTVEMETVKAFQSQIKRQLSEGADTARVIATVESLENIVQNFTDYPTIDYIPQRVQKLLDHVDVASSPGSADLKMTTHALAEIVERLIKEQSEGGNVTDERIAQAYKNLESTANDSESEWLSVCGMAVPKAGPEGVFGARSFREGLMLARDRHPELKQSLRKQRFLDQIVRILQTVPTQGLTVEEVEKISWLAREIDISARIIPARQEVAQEAVQTQPLEEASQPKKTAETKSVSIETDLSDSFTGARMNAKLEITPDETDEMTIEIEVAHTAESSIQEADPETEAVFHEIKAPEFRPIVSSMEKQDPINSAVPIKNQEITTKEAFNPDSLTRKYLTSAQYSEFISTHYSSAEAYEKTLQIEIDSIDGSKSDYMSEYFGEKRASAFDWLQGVNIEEIQEFLRKDFDEKDAVLKKQNISYDSVVAWMDFLGPMMEVVGENAHMTFGELFARWMIDTEMTYYQGGTSASQFTL